MKNEDVINELKRYTNELESVMSRFVKGYNSLSMKREDDPEYRRIVLELIDLFNDSLGANSYSRQIAQEFNYGVQNTYGTPSFKSVENIHSVVRAAITRLSRNTELLDRKRAINHNQHRENIFIIHGRDEAKWRELKDIVRDEFRLNPIILLEQPDAGCPTVIEKFEHYAQKCSYAIAVFTPDDEVSSGGETLLQARPNVIYELGWFCGRSGRSGAMLLLKEGTSIFSDFGGVIRKTFTKNISEKIVEIRQDLVVAGILDEV